ESRRRRPGDTDARAEVFVVNRKVRIAGGPKCAGALIVGPSGVARVVRNGFNVVAETDVQRQSRQHLELVVDKKTDLCGAHAVAGGGVPDVDGRKLVVDEFLRRVELHRRLGCAVDVDPDAVDGTAPGQRMSAL